MFARITYLSFIALSFMDKAPLITIACILSLVIQSQSDKYLMLRRYKKLPYIFSFGKKRILGEMMYSAFYYVITLRWGKWYLNNCYGFNGSWEEYTREIIMFMFVSAASLSHKVAEIDKYFWFEHYKGGKFKKFVNNFRLIAMNNKAKIGKPHSSQEYRIPDSSMRLLMNMGAKEGYNIFGGKLESLKKVIEIGNELLKEDDYYRNCELDLEDDYDRANPVTRYAANKVFLRRRLERNLTRASGVDGDQQEVDEFGEERPAIDDASFEGSNELSLPLTDEGNS